MRNREKRTEITRIEDNIQEARWKYIGHIPKNNNMAMQEQHLPGHQMENEQEKTKRNLENSGKGKKWDGRIGILQKET